MIIYALAFCTLIQGNYTCRVIEPQNGRPNIFSEADCNAILAHNAPPSVTVPGMGGVFDCVHKEVADWQTRPDKPATSEEEDIERLNQMTVKERSQAVLDIINGK